MTAYVPKESKKEASTSTVGPFPVEANPGGLFLKPQPSSTLDGKCLSTASKHCCVYGKGKGRETAQHCRVQQKKEPAVTDASLPRPRFLQVPMAGTLLGSWTLCKRSTCCSCQQSLPECAAAGPSSLQKAQSHGLPKVC